MENFNPIDIVIHIVNILVLFLILRALLYKPVHKYLSDRRAKIKGELDNASTAEENAKAQLCEVEQRVKGAEDEAKKSAAEIIGEANRKASDIIDEAKADADKIVNDAKKKAEKDADDAFEKQQDAIMDMGVKIAGKVLEREVTEADNHAIVEQFFAHSEETK